ncbi:MAG: hypothetical protein ACHQF2_12340, partial [Flavobacteriales bacterium]
MKKLITVCFLVAPLLVVSQGFNGDTGCDCFGGKKGSSKTPFYIGLDGGYFQQSYDQGVTINNPIGVPYGG